MGDMGVPMPVHAMPAGLSLDMTPAFAHTESCGPRGPRCEILCNDKPAWFKGGFPCLGKLTVKCESGEDSPSWAPNFVAASCKGFWSGIFGRTVCSRAPPCALPVIAWHSCIGRLLHSPGGLTLCLLHDTKKSYALEE